MQVFRMEKVGIIIAKTLKMRIKTLVTMAFAAIAVMMTLISCDKHENVPAAEFPVEITKYVSAHFPASSITEIVKVVPSSDLPKMVTDIFSTHARPSSTTRRIARKDELIMIYDVILSDNTTLKFNCRKEIICISSTSQLPEGVTPEQINNYVSENFSNNFILDWKLTKKDQAMKLNNGQILHFNMNGDFLKSTGQK